ncbi:MAG TPA: C25 family cysteine peptidase [bacterium]|nr:C25 family cysteine peptidase [bacterium]
MRARVSFDPSDLRILEENGETHVKMRGTREVGGIQSPALPMAVRLFYIPAGLEVSEVRIAPSRERSIASGVELKARTEKAIEPAGVTRPYPAGTIEETSTMVPASSGVSLGGGTMDGYRIHSVALFPVRWNKNTKEVLLTEDFDVELVTRAESAPRELVHQRATSVDNLFAEAMRLFVVNANEVPAVSDEGSAHEGGFAPRDLPSVEGSEVDMVIITTAAMQANFQTLANWKTKKGVPCVVRTTDWIETNYPAGNDLPERMRSFIRDAYTKWGTRYVLMAGDYAQVPPREVFNRFFFAGGKYIPTDQYYVCLEGTWNSDGDERFGEGAFQSDAGDDVDLYPDLFVGRASVQTVTEANTFVNKCLTYEKTPPAGYVKTHGVFGEVLFPHDWEFGDPPGEISLDGKTLCEVLDGEVDGTWTRHKKYQSDNNESRSIALSELNAGRHLLTIMGHGDAFKFSVGNGINPLIYVADTDVLTNGNKLTYVVATACNPNQFDLECQGESFMNNAGGGAVAVSGPTREDFPLSAVDFHDVMYKLIFTNSISQFGPMNQIKRVPFVPTSQTDSTPDRWTMYTSLLLGDPEMRMWTAEPAALVATHPGSIPLSTTSITVTVTNGATPQADAVVCVSDANGTYSRGRTNGSGQVTLPLTSSSGGTLAVVATKPNFKPYEGSATLTTGSGAVLALQSATIDDDAVAPSNGNGDGRIDAGERVELDFTVRNAGNATANTANAAGSFVTGSTATFNLTFDGSASVNNIYVGKGRVHPATNPFTLNFGTPTIDYQGRPSMTFSPDSTDADTGIFLWQDQEGWHLEWSAGIDSVLVSGTVQTNGKVLATSSPKLENSLDAISVNGSSDLITFSGTTSTRDLVDGIDFALADNTKLTIVNAGGSLGNIAAGATANGTIVFDVASTARDGQVGYTSLSFTASAGGPWSAIAPLVFAGPSLESIQHGLNDGTPPASGDGDGIAEVGETIQITPNILNRGTGTAESVDGVISGGAGISIGDGTDAYGNILPLAIDTGTNGYTFTITSGSGTSVLLTLTDSEGRSTMKTIDFVAPATPAGMSFSSTPSQILVFWTPNTEPDLAGYNVYRSTTLNGTYSKVSFELLRAGARFVDDNLSLGTTFFYKAAAVDSSGNESPRTAAIEAWTTLAQLNNWPGTANSNVFGSLGIADADDSGQGELYVPSQDFKMYVFEPDGVQHDGWPFTTAAILWSAAALGDLDKDGDDEILFGGSDTRFYVLKHDATPFYGSPVLIDLPGTGEEIRSSATVADVDRDAKLEFFFGSDLGKLYAYNDNGTPLVAGNGLLFTAPPGNSSAKIWGNIGVADLAHDGTREIIFTSWNDSCYVITPTGARAPGFPRGGAKDFKRGPTIADLDNDGTMEILAANADGKVYCWNHDGSNYLGAGGVFVSVAPDSVTGSPAVANLDGDAQLEVVFATHGGKIYAFNHNGTGFTQPSGVLATPDPGAPGNKQFMTASPIIADIDGDGDFEIFIGNHNGNFYGYHHNGTLITGFPFHTNLEIHATAAAGDLDGNGDFEVAFASYDGSVNVVDFTGPVSAAAMPWPTQGQNNARTCTYGEAGPYQTGAGDISTPFATFGLEQNTPNPFREGTNIVYSSPRPMPLQLRVFDVSGRLVRTLVDQVMPAGRFTIAWDGRDDHGKETSAGVYFFRLEGEHEMLTKKTVRLR